VAISDTDKAVHRNQLTWEDLPAVDLKDAQLLLCYFSCATSNFHGLRDLRPGAGQKTATGAISAAGSKLITCPLNNAALPSGANFTL
jgi:hypothetical protein